MGEVYEIYNEEEFKDAYMNCTPNDTIILRNNIDMTGRDIVTDMIERDGYQKTHILFNVKEFYGDFANMTGINIRRSFDDDVTNTFIKADYTGYMVMEDFNGAVGSNSGETNSRIVIRNSNIVRNGGVDNFTENVNIENSNVGKINLLSNFNNRIERVGLIDNIYNNSIAVFSNNTVDNVHIKDMSIKNKLSGFISSDENHINNILSFQLINREVTMTNCIIDIYESEEAYKNVKRVETNTIALQGKLYIYNSIIFYDNVNVYKYAEPWEQTSIRFSFTNRYQTENIITDNLIAGSYDINELNTENENENQYIDVRNVDNIIDTDDIMYDIDELLNIEFDISKNISGITPWKIRDESKAYIGVIGNFAPEVIDGGFGYIYQDGFIREIKAIYMYQDGFLLPVKDMYVYEDGFLRKTGTF